MADLVQAQKTPGLPAPVQVAIVQILAMRSPINGVLTAADVKEAVTHSGLFSEANLASDLRATTAGTQARLGVPDIKTVLLVLQQALGTWLAGAPAAARDGASDRLRSPTNRPPPPYRGGPTSAQSALPPSLPVDADPRLVGAVLTRRTDAALAHMKLLQIASLPEPGSVDQVHGSRWMFEIPFATPQGSVVAQFEISRDPSGVTDEPSEQVWRARFSVNVEPVGPVHAQLALMGERAWVTLWAEREAGMQTLREGEALLTQALQDSDLVAKIAFFLGAPRGPVVAPGQVLDSDS